MQDKQSITDNINKLKNEKNAVILAHNYQRDEIQDIADFVGDSLGLSREAVKQDADIIVFCGVDFMAESAAILSPEKTVIMPEIDAGCPMAAMVTPKSLREKREEYPDAAVVCYVNTSAAVKAECDICCTSANAVNVINSLDEDTIIFVPDKNLANFVASQTDKTIIPWEGYCPTHHQILAGDVLLMKEQHPNAEFLAHPECRKDVLEIADKILSTTGMVNYVQQSDSKEFIIGTENGILHRLDKENPDKTFYHASQYAICPNMKMITLDSVQKSLEKMEYKIEVPEDIRKKAKRALDKMLEVKRSK
ncbi:quinolinate synthetase complex, A subunit [Methanohalobium evestigatum Z-7303]|uniref:Quinolinate synthase n=1 Tax=Methanohalobium evestigatum (strain ATCC BAA-1072 / DSM 3721 / NBRC 107634 / OCM 161 / Z-7303) TaxID=644295 RepID=D7E7F9_METEZ|nr:quinolinate synthase NadA [Methanohalobium evestigatum]ADI73908.1 quinolinate synthetase complex, A subunit [Methanohalobium evestigatum Z-7303]